MGLVIALCHASTSCLARAHVTKTINRGGKSGAINALKLECWRIRGVIERNIEMVEKSVSPQNAGTRKFFDESDHYIYAPASLKKKSDLVKIHWFARARNDSADVVRKGGIVRRFQSNQRSRLIFE
jgi:hypothetical protein